MAGETLWELYKDFEGIDPATPYPTSLDAARAAKLVDGLTHCTTCGGTDFTGVITFASDGRPARVLTPQTCIGCGALRQVNWP